MLSSTDSGHPRSIQAIDAVEANHITRSSIVIDTDPGTDDAIALLLLHQQAKNRNIVAVSAQGNNCIEITHLNLSLITQHLKASWGVFRGAHSATSPYSPGSDGFHGEDGLGGLAKEFGDTGVTPITAGGLNELANVIESFEYPCIYISIGPLTNLAELIRNHNECVKNIAYVAIMGGGLKTFNSPHDTEFNFHNDPKAVETIFACDIPLFLFPLDITEANPLFESQINDILNDAGSTPLGEVLRFNYKRCIAYGDNGALIHDAFPVLFSCFPQDFSFAISRIGVDKWGHIFESDTGRQLFLATSTTKELLHNRLVEAFRRQYQFSDR